MLLLDPAIIYCEGTVHVDHVLEYNRDPDHMRDRLLDQANYKKSLDKLRWLLYILDCEVDLLVNTTDNDGLNLPTEKN